MVFRIFRIFLCLWDLNPGDSLKLAFSPFLTIELEQHIIIIIIIMRLIDISQIAVQKGNFRGLQKGGAICSTVDPFSNLRVSRDRLRSLG